MKLTTAENFGENRSLLAISVVVVAAASLVISLNLDSTQTVSSHAESLVVEHLPELRAIESLREYVGTAEVQLYLYYATLDIDEWQRYRQAGQRFHDTLSTINDAGFGALARSDLMREWSAFEHAGEAFHREMQRGGSRNWDSLRQHLADSRKSSSSISTLLNDLSVDIELRVSSEGNRTLAHIAQLKDRLLVFSGSLILLVVALLALVSARNRDQHKLYRRAYYDRLSGLPNRRRLEQDWIEEVENSPLLVSRIVMLMNLDRFQLVTGSYGHAVGDELIRIMSQRVEAFADTTDHVTRTYHLAPATWVIDAQGPNDPAAVRRLSENLRAMAASSMLIDGRDMAIGISVGVTLAPEHGTALDDILRNADASLRVAQSEGGGRIEVFDPSMQERTRTWLSTESALRRALDDGDFELHYQPKISTRSSSVCGAEALIRWRRNGELVSPGLFIPVAEQSGLIVQLGAWVVRAALRQWREWHDQGAAPGVLAVNVSAQQFQSEHFVGLVAEALKDYDVPPNKLELEITEEVASGNPDDVIRTMRGLKALGVRLAIDDFGTGYSSLSYLRNYPLDVLKIDRSFVQQMVTTKCDRAIVHMILALARELECDVVAEGIEDGAQAEMLKALGCDMLQGFLFAKPLPADRFVDHCRELDATLRPEKPVPTTVLIDDERVA